MSQRKVFVRFSLWCGDLTTGIVSPAGARLQKGGEWPRELTDKDGKLVFCFDKADEAVYAAKALEKYLEKHP